MGNQGEGEVGEVEEQEHDGDAEAEFLVGDADGGRLSRHTPGEIEHGWQKQGDDDEDQQGREQAGALGAELLPLPGHPADDDGEAEPEQAGPHDRAGDLGLHYGDLAGLSQTRSRGRLPNVDHAACMAPSVFGGRP